MGARCGATLKIVCSPQRSLQKHFCFNCTDMRAPTAQNIRKHVGALMSVQLKQKCFCKDLCGEHTIFNVAPHRAPIRWGDGDHSVP